MKKIILSTVALMSAVSIQAIETPTEPPVVKHPMTLSGGEVSGQIKAMHIITDKDNNWTPNTGSGYLGTLKYVTPEVVTGLKAGAAFYINGDTGLTDWGETYTGGAATDGVKPAQGMFTSVEGEENAHLGQAYIEYNDKNVYAKAGRMIHHTPLTKIQASLMPNFYEAYVLGTKALPGLDLSLTHFNKISYGSRAATDATLIGEKTWTAGASQLMVGQGGGTLEQAKFVNMGHGAGVSENTSGMTTVGATYTGIKALTINLWDYYAHDIANNLYADIDYKMPVMKGTKLSLSAQYLSQMEIGDELAGELNYSMYGAKAKIGNKKWSAYLAYNQSNDKDTGGGFFNAWGADPAYTSSIFSRNAYRQDVGAYKIGGHYTIMKGLKFKAGYANYGQSKTTGWGTLTANEDATEFDMMLIYKPAKAWTFKIFNAIRTSEYNSDTAEKEMNHVRLVAWYDF
ncbi:MAG: OprD family outer membrane porin [Campylobacterota bacterium]|nr:OprD family outer membrane porin [Campylobacterota bacterium]